MSSLYTIKPLAVISTGCWNKKKNVDENGNVDQCMLQRVLASADFTSISICLITKSKLRWPMTY